MKGWNVCVCVGRRNRAFPEAKISAVCAEFPIGSKFHFTQCKTYFYQLIDKFLKFEEMEYLIHYITFEK